MGSHESSKDMVHWGTRIPVETRRQMRVLAGMYGVTLGAVIETLIETEYAKVMQEAGQ